MPNASGKIDGTTVDVGERQQVDEMPVLERPGEERARRRGRLELGAVGAEADDDEARVDPSHRLEQHLDALLLDQLPEVDDGRRVAREERREPSALPSSGRRSSPLPDSAGRAAPPR